MLHRLLCLRFSFLVHGNWYVLPLCVHQNVLKLLFTVALVGAFDGHLVKLASHAESQRFATNFVVFAAVGLLGCRHLVCDVDHTQCGVRRTRGIARALTHKATHHVRRELRYIVVGLLP